MIVVANQLNSRDIGNLVGVTKADELLNSGRQNFPPQRVVWQIAFIYVTTSRQLHLTHDETDGELGGPTKECGLKLAQAFDAVIRYTAYRRRLARRPTIDRTSRDAVEELADGVFLNRIPRSEREILIDAIMPQTPETESERNRLAQYTLMTRRPSTRALPRTPSGQCGSTTGRFPREMCSYCGLKCLNFTTTSNVCSSVRGTRANSASPRQSMC